jgi:hypothetical protein
MIFESLQSYSEKHFVMMLDISTFHSTNMVDTCGVWNILSSKLLFQAALSANCVFSCTAFVEYECLSKPRGSINKHDEQLQKLLREQQQKGKFKAYHLDIDDLLEVEVLEKRKNLGKGELSSIAFAKRTNQAFLTDDQRARKLAGEVMNKWQVQTTPHLFGWLLYHQFLGDSDKDPMISEHESVGRPLRKYFEDAYQEALRCRLLAKGI